MRVKRILILLLTLTMAIQIQATPRHKSQKHRKAPVKFVQVYHPAYRVNMWVPYWQITRFSTRVVTATVAENIDPEDLVVLTAEDVATDIEALNGVYLSGLITEKDFKTGKKTLLNRIGMTVNPNAPGLSVSEIIAQLETLNGMKAEEIISTREYRKQKNKLLSLI